MKKENTNKEITVSFDRSDNSYYFCYADNYLPDDCCIHWNAKDGDTWYDKFEDTYSINAKNIKEIPEGMTCTEYFNSLTTKEKLIFCEKYGKIFYKDFFCESNCGGENDIKVGIHLIKEEYGIIYIFTKSKATLVVDGEDEYGEVNAHIEYK